QHHSLCEAYGAHLALHSFPTRRSSDLRPGRPQPLRGTKGKRKGLLEGTLQAGTSAVSDKLLDLVGLGGKSAADKGKDTRDYLAADRKSGSAGMPRPISYAVFCLQNKKP